MAAKEKSVGSSRVVAWIVGVTAFGFALLIAFVAVALRIDLDNQVKEALDQEAAEVSVLSGGVDPATGEPFNTPSRFIEVYLSRQVAEPAELIVGGIPGETTIAEQGGDKAPSYAELDESTRANITKPGSSGEAVDPVHGKYSWQSIEVAHPDEVGAIALVYFHRDAEDRLNGELLVLLGIAIAVLLAVGMVAYWASGRILGHTARFADEATKALLTPRPRLPEEGTEEYEMIARSANKLLDKADESLDNEKRFNEDITFALRTPLTIIQGGLEDPGTTDDQVANTHHKIVGEIRYLRDMIDNLAVISRVSRGDYIGQGEPVDSTDVAHDAVIDWRERLGERQVPIEIELGASPEGTHIVVDQSRLRQALDEIIENAVDAVLHAPDSPAENNLITVRTTVDGDADVRRVALEVTDRGRGIPEEDLTAVLKRFGRASNDPHPSGGLGLAVAKNIVGAMRGHIEIRANESEAGVTVAILLPHVEDPNEPTGTE